VRLSKSGSSWNRVGKIGVSGREHARARKRERTRKKQLFPLPPEIEHYARL
jgi:hypothetical protein